MEMESNEIILLWNKTLKETPIYKGLAMLQYRATVATGH